MPREFSDEALRAWASIALPSSTLDDWSRGALGDELAAVTDKLVRGEVLTRADKLLFAIVAHERDRPALIVEDGTFAAPEPPWADLDRAPTRALLEAALPAVGRVHLPRSLMDKHAGTAFAVAPDLVMTNRHVASRFTVGVGEQVRLRANQPAEICFETIPPLVRPVLGVPIIHPHWDIALLQVAALPPGHPTLELGTELPAALDGRAIATVGFPSRDEDTPEELMDAILGRGPVTQRIQPGYARGGRSTTSYDHPVVALTHDSSTAGGSSGSAILDLGSGLVVGVHFGGSRRTLLNYAVPAGELVRDPRVVAAGVTFVGQPPAGVPEWLGAGN